MTSDACPREAKLRMPQGLIKGKHAHSNRNERAQDRGPRHFSYLHTPDLPEDWTQMIKLARTILAVCLLCSFAVWPVAAQDVPNSKDPAGMKRYEGSELIGYRAPKF